MSLLIKILAKPEQLKYIGIDNWQQLLIEANASQLAGRLHYLCNINGISIPTEVSWHLESAYKIAQKQRKQAIREFYELSKIGSSIRHSAVFLKGAAYIAKDLPCSIGRTFSDIDLLVKKEELAHIEQILKFSDWVQTDVDDYDEQYYRAWMHEIPPLVHVQRGTVLDVHHNILPSTNAHTPDADKFKIEHIDVDMVGVVNTLSNIDMLIHTAVHLFTESEFHNGLRDISDIDMLIRDFQKKDNDGNFLMNLICRSNELGLFPYVRLALRYAHLILHTPLKGVDKAIIESPHRAEDIILDFCFINSFKPNHSSCQNWKSTIGKFLLYWRGHYIRMPLKLLIPHLIKKSWKRIQEIRQEGSAPNEKLMP